MWGFTRLAPAIGMLVVLGCDSDAPAHDRSAGDEGNDAGRDAGAGPEDAEIADAAITADAAIDAGKPRNDSFETAIPVALNTKPPLHDVTRPSEVDYFSFEGTAGAFYALHTDRHPFSPDTVIALFDPDKQELAENDDGGIWPGDTIDSRLVVRLLRSGTYFVRVQNQLGDQPIVPPVYYHLSVDRLTSGMDGVALQETDSPEPVHFANDTATTYLYATLIGDFATVHAAAFAIQGRTDQVLVGHLLPSGMPGSGSTARIGVLRVDDADGHGVAKIDGTTDQEIFHPPVADADYQLSAALGSEAGKNDFFAIDLTMIPDNPREQSEDANGAIEGAESIELEQGSFSRRGLLLSSLPADDVDYYSFESPMVAGVTISCEGQTGGSGVVGLHVDLRDAKDKVLAAADETPDLSLLIDGITLPEPGTYYLRLSSKTKKVKDPIEPWARCAVIAQP